IRTVSTNTQTVVADQELRDQVARLLHQMDSDRPNYSVGQSESLPSNLVGKTLNINSNNLTIADDGTLTSQGALSIAGLAMLQGGIFLPSAVPVSVANSLYNDNGDLKWNGSAVGLSSSIAGTVGYLSKFATASTIGDSILFESSGKIGIGTTNPLSKFDIRGGINAGANGTEFVLTDVGIINAGTWNGTAIDIAHGGTGTVTGSITGTGALAFSAGGSNQNVTLTPSGIGYTLLGGNVGIGTTSPNTKLEINGTFFSNSSDTAAPATGVAGGAGDKFILYQGTESSYPYSLGVNSNMWFSVPSDSYYSWYINGAEKMKLDTNGSIAVTSLAYGLPETSGATQTYANMRLQSMGGNVVLDFGDAGSAGAWLQTTNKANLNLNYPLLLNPNGGNVGIGTSAPGAKLTLNGGNFQHIAAGNPTLKGSVSGKGYGIYVSGKYVFIAAGNLGFKIVDVTNPASPVTISSNSFAAVADIYVSGKYAYIADGASGLRIEDISNPKSPNLVATIATTGANGVYVSGKYAYVADLTGGLRVIDVSVPASPVLAGTNALSNANGVYVSGKYAYVADGVAGLRIIEVTNPAAMAVVGTYNTPDSANRVYVSGKYAYVADGSSLQIIDVSDPTSPVLAGSYSSVIDYYTGVYVSGKYAYVASGSDYDDGSGLRVIDVSVPAATTLAGAYNTVSYGASVYVSGKYAYLTTSGSTRIVDISGIETPSLYAGNILTNNITITENANIANDLYVRGSGDFGGLALFQNGFFSSADSFFSGNVGIGIASAATKLQVLGDIRTGTTGANGCVQGFGGASIAGTCSSDSGLKTNVNYLGNILDRFVQIKPAAFRWNETAQTLYKNSADVTNYGIIAQDLEQLFPELVATDSNGYKMVNYSALNVYALEAIKEQQAEINDLKLTLGIDGSVNSTSTVNNFNTVAVEQGSIVKIVKDTLASLGMIVENGAASVREMFAERMVAKNATIDLVTSKKIQLIDEVTGEVYCTKIVDGKWSIIKGLCEGAVGQNSGIAGNGNLPKSDLNINVKSDSFEVDKNGTSTETEI
ncbi:MAG: tail fiber domain-containing protein, partial [Candidatus Paceibacterota bacterium]